jgi:ubiquinone/menaquinone biosynthesis C-methylase UbiE
VLASDPRDLAERLLWASDALHAAAAISAAHRLGVLAMLEAGPVRPEVVAAQCQLDVHGVVVLLEALAAMGLVDSAVDGRFRTAVPGLRALGTRSDSGDLLADAIRSGRAPLECDVPAGASDVYPDTVTHLATLVGPAAEAVAECLDGAARVLDVGAGAAPWSLALARRDPRCRVAALDLPGVLTTTQEAVAAAGCSEQFRYLAGDMFTVSLARSAYDLVLLGNLCHLFDAPTNRRLLQRLRPVLRSGGRVAVVDVLPSATDPASRRSVALYAAGLRTRTSSGGVHNEESYRAWLSEAGFHDIQVRQASRMPPISLITGSALPRSARRDLPCQNQGGPGRPRSVGRD